LYVFIAKQLVHAPRWKKLLPITGIGIVFIIPYFSITQSIADAKELPGNDRVFALSRYLIKGIKGKVPLNEYKVAADTYIPHVMGYIYMANEKGMAVKKTGSGELQAGDKVLV